MSKDASDATALIQPLLAAGSAAEALELLLEHLSLRGASLVDRDHPGDGHVAAVGDVADPLEEFGVPQVPEVLGVAWEGSPAPELLTPALDLLGAARARQRLEAEIVRDRRHSDEAQALAHVGDYEWLIGADHVQWSDELYRIYGLEPGSVVITYERFMSMVHPDDQLRIRAIHQHAYETGEPFSMTERIVRPDGDVRVLQSSGLVEMDQDGNPIRMRGTCLDVTARARAEQALRASIEDVVALDVRLAAVNQARKQAAQINDNIIQGLSAALLAVEQGRRETADDYVSLTLASAREMMHDLLATSEDGQIDTDELLREGPSTVAPALVDDGGGAGEEQRGEERPRTRVLLVDDAADYRFLLREYLNHADGFRVIAEAADGREGIELAGELQPDVVLLDLAMPEMDGLTALPQILEASPTAAVIVLSGFGNDQAAGKALAAGARAYVEKGRPVGEVVAAIRGQLPTS